MPVAGRTRWLKIPYRNTQEIYEAAYGMIADHDEIQKSLTEDGELVTPDLQDAIVEVHPEVSFAAMLGRPLDAPKHGAEGRS